MPNAQRFDQAQNQSLEAAPSCITSTSHRRSDWKSCRLEKEQSNTTNLSRSTPQLVHRNSGKTIRNNQTGEHLFSDCLRLLAVFLRRWSTVIGYELGLIRLIALPPAFPCQPPRPAFYRGSKIFPHLCTSITSTIVVSLKSDSKRTQGPECQLTQHYIRFSVLFILGAEQLKICCLSHIVILFHPDIPNGRTRSKLGEHG